LATDIATPAVTTRWNLFRPLLVLGPGLVFVLGSLGPRDLVANSIAGSTHGYSLIWLIAAALLARYVILDTSARYVVVTGESLLAGCGHRARWTVYCWFGLTILKRHVATLLDLTLLGAAGHFVYPLPTPHSKIIWGLSSWVAGFILMYWGRYRAVEQLCRPMAAVMGACLAAVAIMSRPDFTALLKGTLTPVLPQEGGAYSPAIVLMTLVSAVGSFSNLKYSAYVHEKGWRKVSFLKNQRFDLMLSMAGLFVMLAMVQVAAAGALMPRGIQVTKLEDLIPMFAAVIGDAGAVLLGATLWAIIFYRYVGSGTAYGIMISDVYHRFIRPSKVIEKQDLGPGACHLPAYRWLVVYIFLSPLYVFLTDWTPIGLVIVKSALSVIGLPVIVFMLVRLTADRKVMGEQANSLLRNALLMLTLAAAVYVSFQGVGDMLAGKDAS